MTFLRSGLSGQSIVVTAIKNMQFVNALQQNWLLHGEDLNLPLEDYDAWSGSLLLTYRPMLLHSLIYLFTLLQDHVSCEITLTAMK